MGTTLRKYRLHWSLHPMKDDEWYYEQKKRMTEDEIARELDIDYRLSVSGKVFTAFNPLRHCSREAIPFNVHKQVYRIWDFGRTNSVIYGQIDDHGRRRVLRERVLTDSTTPEQIRIALQDSARWFPGGSFTDICDPAGSYLDERGNDTDVAMMQREGISPTFANIISIPTKDRKVRGRKMIARDLEASPKGKEALSLWCSEDESEGCPILLAAFQGGYAWKKDRNNNIIDDVIDEKHPYEDVMDCLIYWYLETDSTGGLTAKDFAVDYLDYSPYLE